MTNAEIALIRETGEFFHVTGRNRQAAIEVGGSTQQGAGYLRRRYAPNVFFNGSPKG